MHVPKLGVKTGFRVRIRLFVIKTLFALKMGKTHRYKVKNGMQSSLLTMMHHIMTVHTPRPTQ
jgi:hypothetical protein